MSDESIWITEQDQFDQFLAKTLNNSVEKLEKEYGTNQALWRWGDFHQVAFEHPLANANFLTDKLFTRHRPVEVGGSGVTVMAARSEERRVGKGCRWRWRT